MDQRFATYVKKLFIMEHDGTLIKSSPYKFIKVILFQLDATWLI